MKCSILLPFSPGSCLCSCASNQAKRKLFLRVTVTYFLFFHVVDVEASSNDEGAWWEGPGRFKEWVDFSWSNSVKQYVAEFKRIGVKTM